MLDIFASTDQMLAMLKELVQLSRDGRAEMQKIRAILESVTEDEDDG